MNRSLRLSLIDAFLFSLMVGAGETYLPAFGLSIGMNEVLSGLFGTLPMIMGAIVQMFTTQLIPRIGSVKRWVVFTVILQACCFLPLIYISMGPAVSYPVVFIIAAVYWGSGFSAGPSWNYWMGHLVSKEEAAHYFSQRLRISQVGILLGLVGAGLALHYKWTFGPFSSVFSIVFLLAFVFRLSSGVALSLKNFEPGWNWQDRKFALQELWQQITGSSVYREFFGFLFVFFVAIFISSPFVNPYFLKKLNLSYGFYMLALAGLFIGKIMAFPIAEKCVKRWGVARVFSIGILGISPLPALWVLGQDLWYIVFLQFLSGAFWAFFEVSLSVIFFNQVKSHEKIPVLTVYNLFQSTAIILGSLIGGKLLSSLHESLEGYYFIFIFGAFLRTLLAVLCINKIRRQATSY